LFADFDLWDEIEKSYGRTFPSDLKIRSVFYFQLPVPGHCLPEPTVSQRVYFIRSGMQAGLSFTLVKHCWSWTSSAGNSFKWCLYVAVARV